jgi:CRP/FNR family transcriptional regulator, cyclic AMP receptor protein
MAEERLQDALRRDGHRRRFPRGQALFTEGDRAERVFVIERGVVLISCTTPGGREIVLGLRGSGDVIGELSALDGKPRSATAEALDEVEAVVTSAAALNAALRGDDLAAELIRMLVARLRDADRKRLEFASLDTLGRVAWRLVELAERFGRPDGAHITIELPLSQEQLASWCAASRESTVKALGTLRDLGCIATGRRSLVVLDDAALRGYARATP